MTEFAHNSSSEPMSDQTHTIAELGSVFVRQRDFLGTKVARESMDELGVSDVLDDNGAAELEYILGVCATGGLVLAMKEEVDEASVELEVSRFLSDLPESMQSIIGWLIPIVVSRGIAFYNNELIQDTPKFQEWFEEFNLLTRLEK